jgi:hypothetical protein
MPHDVSSDVVSYVLDWSLRTLVAAMLYEFFGTINLLWTAGVRPCAANDRQKSRNPRV